MFNYVQLQEDVTGALLGADALSQVSVVQYRKLRLQSVVDYSSVWLTPREGKAGCGILVEMPQFDVTHPNLPGPERQLSISCAVIEEPNINMQAGAGTMLSAEEVAELVLDTLHGYLIEGVGGLYAGKNAIRSADEFEGLVAYRVTLEVRSPREQTPRVALPTIQEQALQVTLTCTTAGAEIRYTTDGSFPGRSNAASVVYQGPFQMAGPVLRWAAYKPGMTPSHVGQATNPS